jgi:hypothetical protein
MSNRNKAQGTTFETEILKYLRPRGFTKAYRPAVKGSYDTGDINGIRSDTRQAIVQCKHVRKFALSEWLNATEGQASQEEVGGDALPILVVKRPGIGAKTSGKHYAILTLEELVSLLQEAGYS